jgi:hypothetical protein
LLSGAHPHSGSPGDPAQIHKVNFNETRSKFGRNLSLGKELPPGAPHVMITVKRVHATACHAVVCRLPNPPANPPLNGLLLQKSGLLELCRNYHKCRRTSDRRLSSLLRRAIAASIFDPFFDPLF